MYLPIYLLMFLPTHQNSQLIDYQPPKNIDKIKEILLNS